MTVTLVSLIAGAAPAYLVGLLTARRVLVRVRRQLAAARHDAEHDALTGLANRRAFYREAADAVARGGVRAAVALVDLDGFKQLNDTHGHGVGDLVLCELGRRWTAVVGDDGLVARLGGDEFAAYVRLRDGETVQELSWALADITDAPIDLDDLQLSVTVSVGAVEVPAAGADLSLLLTQADAALYRDKVALPKTAPVMGRPPVRVRPSVRLRDMAELGRDLLRGVRTA